MLLCSIYRVGHFKSKISSVADAIKTQLNRPPKSGSMRCEVWIIYLFVCIGVTSHCTGGSETGKLSERMMAGPS